MLGDRNFNFTLPPTHFHGFKYLVTLSLSSIHMSDHISENLVVKSPLPKTLMVVGYNELRNLKIFIVDLNFLQPFSLYGDKVEEVARSSSPPPFLFSPPSFFSPPPPPSFLSPLLYSPHPTCSLPNFLHLFYVG
jgi:hypothetical protein